MRTADVRISARPDLWRLFPCEHDHRANSALGPAAYELPHDIDAILIVWEPATCVLVFGDAGLTGSARDQNLGDYARARCQ
ncbi:hypothetical protein [Streptomyces atratus]|uniref:hypothetical protein n=1 Tax=Streptomyces atratus TaxID=1893 RepID=UPI00364BB17B